MVPNVLSGPRWKSFYDCPDRTSVAGVRYLDLQRKARQSGRPTDELIQLYALECFLERLTLSAFAESLVLKGWVLLAALDARRPTRDIDLATSALRNTEAEILAVVHEIAGISLADGIEFDFERAVAEVIREEDEYVGRADMMLDADLRRLEAITLAGLVTEALERVWYRGGGSSYRPFGHTLLPSGRAG
jgi:hypothetical protein